MQHPTWPTSAFISREWSLGWDLLDVPDGAPAWDAPRDPASVAKQHRQHGRAIACAAEVPARGYSIINGQCSDTERFFGIDVPMAAPAAAAPSPPAPRPVRAAGG